MTCKVTFIGYALFIKWNLLKSILYLLYITVQLNVLSLSLYVWDVCINAYIASLPVSWEFRLDGEQFCQIPHGKSPQKRVPTHLDLRFIFIKGFIFMKAC